MEIQLEDDTKAPSVGIYGPSLAREVAEISKFKLNRNSSAYSWARNLRFLTYDDEDDDEDEKEWNQGLVESDEEENNEESDEDKELQRAIELSLALEREAKQDIAPTDTSTSDGIKLAGNHHFFEPQASNTTSDDSDDEAAQLDYAIALSLAEDDNQTSPRPASPTTEDQGGRNIVVKKIPHTKTCKTCQRYPRFPSWKKPTKFRIIHFNPEVLEHNQLCDHYIAVSYCWKSDSTGNAAAAEKTYRVRIQQKDGSFIERQNRAPNETIDRAVAAARVSGSKGTRLIWIDQECLPQDDSREQELGIQAMDMVYQRAHLSLGLFESTIQIQAQLDVVASVLEWGMSKEPPSKRRIRQRRPGLPMPIYCEYLMDFLEFFADDHWNTRAWILQEAFSSSTDMAIMIRTGPGVQFHKPPGSSVLNHDPNWVSGTFTIFMLDVLRLFKVSREFLISMVKSPSMSGQVYSGVAISSDAYGSEWFNRAANILERIDNLYPVPAATTNRHAYMYSVGGSNFGQRNTCTAAAALHFLQPRLNHRPADRVAILANLCDYEIRLDTTEIEKRFKSLATCLFTLAFLNGDLSLLVPSAYRKEITHELKEGPSWALPFQEIFYSVNMKALRAGYNLSLRNTERYLLSESGLTLPGYAWNVDRLVDLTPIKVQWQSEWRRSTCYQVVFEDREDETMEELEARKAEVSRLVQEANGFNLPFDARTAVSEVFQPDPALGARVIRTFSADAVENVQEAQYLIGNIFLDILRFLYYNGEVGLANSIWHSIRIDCRKIEQGSEFSWSQSSLDALPDTIAELLNNMDLLTSNPGLLLQLDRNELRGTFHQIWLVERIMVHGNLWAGQYISPSTLELEFEEAGRFQNGGGPRLRPGKRQHILQSQTDKQFLAYKLKGNMHQLDEDKCNLSIGGIVNLMYLTSRMRSGEEGIQERELRLHQQVATFDVDGPCLVVTPFDSDMERLPRAALRSMASAWIVDRAPGEPEEEKIKVNGNLDYEDKTTSIDGEIASQENLVSIFEDLTTADSKELEVKFEDVSEETVDLPPKIDKGKGIAKSEEETKVPTTETGLHLNPIIQNQKLCVKGRVQGMWEIMEEPLHTYTFV